MAKNIILQDQTYKRLVSIQVDLSALKKRDVDHDDLINFLIDAYVDSTAFSGEHGGG